MEDRWKAVALLFFFNLVFFSALFLNPDKGAFLGDNAVQSSVWKYIPFKEFSENGEIPLWNRFWFSGHPFVGNLQSSMFYPLYLGFYFLPFESLLDFMLFLHFLLAGIFMYFFLKELKLGFWPSLIGATAFMFSGKIASHIWFGHIVFWVGYAFIPLLFLVLEKTLNKKSIAWSAVLGIVIAFDFFGSHTQLFFYTMILLSLYALYKLFFEGKEWKENVKKGIPLLLLALVLGLGISAVQILPAVETGSLAVRSEGIDFETSAVHSWKLENLASFVVPDFFGNPANHTYWGRIYYSELVLYAGIAVLILAFFALLFERKKVLFFAGALVLMLLFAFGENFPLYKFLFEFVPGFDLFRAPSRILFLMAFALAVLAGFGAKALENAEKEKVKKAAKIGAVFSLVAVAVFAGFLIAKPKVLEFGEKVMLEKYSGESLEKKEYFLQQIPKVFDGIAKNLGVIAIVLSCFFGLVWLWILGKIDLKKLKTGILLLVFLDLAFYGSIFLDLQNPEGVFSSTPAIDFIAQDSGKFRVFDINMQLWFQRLVRKDIESVKGYDPTILTDYARFLQKFNEEKVLEPGNTDIEINEINNSSNLVLLDLLNVKYYVFTKEVSVNGLEKVFEDENSVVYERKEFLPRAYVVRNSNVLKREKILQEIVSEDFDARNTVLFEEGYVEEFEGEFEGSFEEAEIVYYSSNTIEVKAEGEGFLVLSEQYFPGWKAFVDGKETEILRGNYLFRTVYLDKGMHSIVFSYEPESFRTGALLSIIGLIVAGGIVFAKRRTLS